MKINNNGKVKFKREGYDDDIGCLRTTLGIEEVEDKPTTFVFDVNGENVLELTLDQITAILKANGYADPIVARPPELLMLEKGRLQHEKKKYNI